ncbi:MAG: peptidase P60 [Hyphomicrobiaceae bacterium]|nr:peptidase P60 [Hyphomicrobiaceae bacterium]
MHLPPVSRRPGIVVQPFSRADIVNAARRWVGTPYHHQASCLGVGTDCVGLVRGVWRQLYGADAEEAGPYTRDWAEATGDETLVAAARRHLVEIDPARLRPGDVAVFRYRTRAIAKHVGIAARGGESGPLAPIPSTLIHAVEGAPVSEVPLSPWWRRRIAAAFAFPGVED